jgi:tRNA-splicing ligase RtcB (3'-phosphate/5'-hydroxy nucleic acid ligase)
METDLTVSIEQVDEVRWRIPQEPASGMRVAGMVYANGELMEKIKSDRSLMQVANVAFLPGIVKYSMAMPDIHWGYGFPIGGVAATDVKNDGVVSPGGVGYDINCGVRLVRTDLTLDEVYPKIRALVYALFRDIPCGVGVGGRLKLGDKELRRVCEKGSRWMRDQGYATDEDVEHTESSGSIEGADASAVSARAFERARPQVGTLGAGNHFMEVQVVDHVFDEEAARAMGLAEGTITLMIHCGSRGFGHQICDDYIKVSRQALHKYGISVPDQQLGCMPVDSSEGQRYLGAMRSAANYAWANRQYLMHLARGTFEHFFNKSWRKMGMELIYDVAHNMAKIEEHEVNGERKMLCVHRKGATRAFPPGHPDIPEKYRDVGQPVLIPGDMGTNSYVLAGTQSAMNETFGSTCHGAGRVMSRHQAVKAAKGRSIERELEAKGIIVKGRGRRGLDEEQPDAYKDVNVVVDVVHKAGLSKKVARMRPLGVIKG